MLSLPSRVLLVCVSVLGLSLIVTTIAYVQPVADAPVPCDRDYACRVKSIANTAYDTLAVWYDGTFEQVVINGERISVDSEKPKSSILLIGEKDGQLDCTMIPVRADAPMYELSVGDGSAAAVSKREGERKQPSATALKAAGELKDVLRAQHIQRVVVGAQKVDPAGDIPFVSLRRDKEEININSVGMRYVLIDAGRFTMGEPTEFTKGEYSRDVTITRPFEMQQTEVTCAHWQLVHRRTDIEADLSSSSFGTVRSILADANAHLPIGNITWAAAKEFCQRLSKDERRTYALPTEAQWEYSCRAGTTGDFYFPNGSRLSDYSWYGENSGARPHEVATRKPNPWKLYDMTGNMRELCEDWMVIPYPGGARLTDPTGGTEQEAIITGRENFTTAMKSVRGGMYCGIPAHDLCGGRGVLTILDSLPYVGFRTVRVLAP